uniref:SUEL-type lectin domain-containing protein n=1 Tax=Cyprinus carpio TaxID=7962 RepID=A0A8C1JP99_CYPCA
HFELFSIFFFILVNFLKLMAFHDDGVCFLSLGEFKSKVVCEGERLRLGCKVGMQIAVYAAMFGRTQQGTLECPPHHQRAPSVDCSSDVALQVMTSRCQGKRSCVVRASTQEFGDPCYHGTHKYLSVIHTCERIRKRSLACFLSNFSHITNI